MKLSAFGRKFTADAGITSLMDDLGGGQRQGLISQLGFLQPQFIAAAIGLSLQQT